MRAAAKATLWAIGGSLIATPITQPVSWYIDRWLNDHSDAVPGFVRRGWDMIQSVASHVPFGLFLGIAIGASFAFIMLRGWRPPGWAATSKDQGASFDIEDQKRLADRLRTYLKPKSHAEFKFASLKQMDLTETIESIFTTAGWETNYWNIPVESQRSDHLQGIEVSGHNKFLVNAIASEMRDAGLPAIRSKVEPVESPMNAERWASLENRLRITVGHH